MARPNAGGDDVRRLGGAVVANTTGKRPKTVAWYDDAVRLHLIPAFGTRPLGSLTPLDVQRFVNDLAERFAPSTTRGYYAALRVCAQRGL